MSQICVINEDDCIELAASKGMKLVPDNYTCVPFERFLEEPDDAFVFHVVILCFSFLLVVYAMRQLCCVKTKNQ